MHRVPRRDGQWKLSPLEESRAADVLLDDSGLDIADLQFRVMNSKGHIVLRGQSDRHLGHFASPLRLT